MVKRRRFSAEFERAYHDSQDPSLTADPCGAIILLAGETEARTAGEQPARDSRLGKRRDIAAGTVLSGCPQSSRSASRRCPSCLKKPVVSNNFADFRV